MCNHVKSEGQAQLVTHNDVGKRLKYSPGSSIVAGEQLVHQLLLIWVIKNMTSIIGDQLLTRSMIVVDACVWNPRESLIGSGYRLVHFFAASSSCDESRNDFSRY